MNIDLRDMLDVGRGAIARARKVLDTTAVSTVRSKHERDLVSNVDVAIEREVREYVSARTPQAGFLGEEEGTSDTPTEVTWILDPIDGTSNFLHGIPLFGISLALVIERQPVLGVISLPGLNNEYYGANGLGSFKDGDPISARDTAKLGESIVSIGDYAVGTGASVRNEHRLSLTAELAASVERVRMLGSAAVDMAWLAEGRTDGVLALTNSAWDFTAGVAIAREAGARVRDVDGSEHSLDARGIVAAAPHVSDQLLELTQSASRTPEDGAIEIRGQR